eukprot:SAG11_NODE_32147_length_286_cov_0.449198_1_plen_26_part_10
MAKSGGGRRVLNMALRGIWKNEDIGT